ncbi:dihydrodipicolinate synthase family protein, partial [Streptomyces sp. NPDC087787]|uniref:dihydrodipicolinate synthase family protein n=1 Tax=Streptomyces sp. NPDC087787 TaxID=3365803 RepID=UPI003800C305
MKTISSGMDMKEIADVVRRLGEGMGQGVLSFPLTSFQRNGDLDPGAFRAYLERQLAAGPGAVFPACGTGEFTALD